MYYSLSFLDVNGLLLFNGSIKMEEWPLLHNDDDCMTDVVDAYSNLREPIGKHLLSSRETRDLVAIPVGDITARVVCMKMLGSSCIFCVSIS